MKSKKPFKNYQLVMKNILKLMIHVEEKIMNVVLLESMKPVRSMILVPVNILNSCFLCLVLTKYNSRCCQSWMLNSYSKRCLRWWKRLLWRSSSKLKLWSLQCCWSDFINNLFERMNNWLTNYLNINPLFINIIFK